MVCALCATDLLILLSNMTTNIFFILLLSREKPLKKKFLNTPKILKVLFCWMKRVSIPNQTPSLVYSSLWAGYSLLLERLKFSQKLSEIQCIDGSQEIATGGLVNTKVAASQLPKSELTYSINLS